MQITRDNASSVQKMITQMFGGKNGTPDPYGTDYGNYSLRFTPTDRPFNKPNWDEIMTKRDKPAMSEDEFNEAIKELARKEFSTGKRDHQAYRNLSKQYSETASPDRKAIYEESMKKTGGKMNAACMFWDKSGNKTLSWHPLTGDWDAISTKGEFDRARAFTSIFRDYQLSVPIKDRLKGTWTLGQYERQYRQALYDACKEADPNWELGKKLPAGALNNVTRESVDSTLVKSGDKLVKKNLDVKG